MKNTYRIVPLPTEIAAPARAAAATGALDHVLRVADSPTGYPCRHCLQWARPGEHVILFPFSSIAAGRPYSETGPIFVHAHECDRYSATSEFPTHFRDGRVLRAYDRNDEMIDAVIVHDGRPEETIDQLLDNPDVAFLQVRSASRGCYTMGVTRQ